jgi:hypothetical protein
MQVVRCVIQPFEKFRNSGLFFREKKYTSRFRHQWASVTETGPPWRCYKPAPTRPVSNMDPPRPEPLGQGGSGRVVSPEPTRFPSLLSGSG